MKISLVMIVKDEEEVLGRCLDSVQGIPDEIVIVDTGSQDKTKEIARTYTDRVYEFEWCDDFSAARNFALSKATGEYAFWLDADDFIPEKSRNLFPNLRAVLETADIVMCPYGIGGTNNLCAVFYRERFFRRAAGFQWQGRVHECIVPAGKIIHSDFMVLHLGSAKVRGMRNLMIYQKWAKEEPLSPRDRFYYGRELYYQGLYTEAAAVLEEMIAGEGWYVNKIDACRTLSLCYLARGDSARALEALFRSFRFGEPRAFVCCEIGKVFKAQKNFREAAFWYETALRCGDHSAEGDFEEPNCRALTPLLELVCCYYALGDRKKAQFFHKKTEALAPDHPSVVYNRTFFSSMK